MFDPERDEDTGRRQFYLRLLAIAVISAAGCLVLYPSVTGFGAGPDHQIDCLAVKDGWHGDRSAPTTDQELQAALPAPLTPDQFSDPQAVARFRDQFRAAQADPAVQNAYAYTNWVDGPGACIRESRHRLIRSGLGLVGLAGFVAGAAYFRRTRENLRHPPELVGA